MFLIRCNCVMSCLITILFFHIGTFVHLFFICLNHLSLFSRIFLFTGTTPTLSRIFLFLILSFLVCPYIHCNILISQFSSFDLRFLTSQYSVLYNIVGLSITLWNLPLSFGAPSSHNTLDANLHLIYPAPIWCVTSSSISLFPWIIHNRPKILDTFFIFPCLNNNPIGGLAGEKFREGNVGARFPSVREVVIISSGSFQRGGAVRQWSNV